MLDVVIIVVLALLLGKMARDKGRSLALALYALIVPAVGIAVAVVAGIAIMFGTGNLDLVNSPYYTPIMAFTLLIEVITAVGVYFWVRSMPPRRGEPIPGAYPTAASPGLPYAAPPAYGYAAESPGSRQIVVPGIVAEPGYRGYCTECGETVALGEDGGCLAGHGAECVTRRYHLG